MVAKVIVELVGEAHVDERRDGADAPAGEQRHQVIEAVVGEDRHAIAFSDTEMVQGAGEFLHLRDGGSESQRAVAVDPAQRDLVGRALGPVTEKLMHQHNVDLLLSIDIRRGNCRPGSAQGEALFLSLP